MVDFSQGSEDTRIAGILQLVHSTKKKRVSEVPLELDRGEDMTLKVLKILKIPKFTHKIFKVITNQHK